MKAAERLADEWIEIGNLEDIPRLGARVVASPRGDIAVFRNNKDEVFALDDKCPHKGGPLSRGRVHGRKVTCPQHNWCMHLDTGEAVAPDEGFTPYYAVRVSDGKVYLCLARMGGTA